MRFLSPNLHFMARGQISFSKPRKPIDSYENRYDTITEMEQDLYRLLEEMKAWKAHS